MPRFIKVLIAFSLIVLAIIMYFVSKDTPSSEVANPVLDLFDYTEEDYDLMRAYYNADTAFQKMLNQNIEAGDSSAVQVKELLGTSYQFRYNTSLEERDIKGMVYAYKTSKEALDKFAAIEDQLKKLEELKAPKKAADSAVQRQLDSLMNLAREGNLRK